MYECSECERVVGPDVLLCRHQGGATCPFKVEQINATGSRIQGISFILLGSFFLVLILFFPVAPEAILSSSISTSIIRIIWMSLFILFGLFVVFVGASLIFSKRLLIFNTADRVSYQTSFFCSYQYRTKIFEDTKLVEIKSKSRTGQPAVSIAMLGDTFTANKLLRKVQTQLRKDDPENYDRAKNELVRISQRILEGTFLDLIGRGLIKVYSTTCYSSQVKTMEQTSSSIAYLLYPGVPQAEKIEGHLERQILHIVNNWNEQELRVDQPLAPTIKLIVQTITANESIPLWQSIIAKVVEDAQPAQGESLETLNLFSEETSPSPYKPVEDTLLKTQESIPGMYRIIMEEVEALFTKQSEKFLVSNLFSTELFRLKYLRIGIVVAILLAFSLGRYYAGISRVHSLKEYVESAPVNVSSLREKVTDLLPSGSSEAISKSARIAMERLEQWMENPSKNVKEIIALTRSSDVTIRRATTRLLGYMQGNAQLVVPTLKLLLRDSDPTVRQYAVSALANYGVSAQIAIPDLIFLLENDPVTAPLAAQTLGTIGSSDSRKVVDALSGALVSENPLVQTFAKDALEKIGTDDALSAIEKAVKSGRLNTDPDLG